MGGFPAEKKISKIMRVKVVRKLTKKKWKYCILINKVNLKSYKKLMSKEAHFKQYLFLSEEWKKGHISYLGLTNFP